MAGSIAGMDEMFIPGKNMPQNGKKGKAMPLADGELSPEAAAAGDFVQNNDEVKKAGANASDTPKSVDTQVSDKKSGFEEVLSHKIKAGVAPMVKDIPIADSLPLETAGQPKIQGAPTEEISQAMGHLDSQQRELILKNLFSGTVQQTPKGWTGEEVVEQGKVSPDSNAGTGVEITEKLAETIKAAQQTDTKDFIRPAINLEKIKITPDAEKPLLVKAAQLDGDKSKVSLADTISKVSGDGSSEKAGIAKSLIAETEVGNKVGNKITTPVAEKIFTDNIAKTTKADNTAQTAKADLKIQPASDKSLAESVNNTAVKNTVAGNITVKDTAVDNTAVKKTIAHSFAMPDVVLGNTAAAPTARGVSFDGFSVNSASLTEQVSQAVRTNINLANITGTQQITINLSPPELGRVFVRLYENDGEITGRLEVERASTRADIEQSLPGIVKTLQDAGVNVRKIEVNLSENNNSKNGGFEFSKDAEANRFTGRQQQGDRDSQNQFSEQNEAGKEQQNKISDSAINVYI